MIPYVSDELRGHGDHLKAAKVLLQRIVTTSADNALRQIHEEYGLVASPSLRHEIIRYTDHKHHIATVLANDGLGPREVHRQRDPQALLKACESIEPTIMMKALARLLLLTTPSPLYGFTKACMSMRVSTLNAP